MEHSVGRINVGLNKIRVAHFGLRVRGDDLQLSSIERSYWKRSVKESLMRRGTRTTETGLE
jgi:hypothetical protein